VGRPLNDPCGSPIAALVAWPAVVAYRSFDRTTRPEKGQSLCKENTQAVPTADPQVTIVSARANGPGGVRRLFRNRDGGLS
jgi:hypothetical protein